MSDSTLTRHGRLILVPAVITLAVTLLRLTGELQQWSSTLFSRAAGGGGALIGIVWLIPIFGIYFALKLARAGEGPGRVLRGVGLCVLAFVVMVLSGVGATALGLDPNSRATLVVFVVAAIVSGLLAFKAWPALGRVLLAYARGRTRPRGPHHAGSDPRAVGHALRRPALAGVPGDGAPAAVVLDRPRPADDHLDQLHPHDGDALWPDRGRHRHSGTGVAGRLTPGPAPGAPGRPGA